MEHIQHMSTTMAAKLLGVHKTTVQRQINAGGLKAEMLKANQGGGSHGLSNMIPVEEVLKRLDTEGRILWYEWQAADRPPRAGAAGRISGGQCAGRKAPASDAKAARIDAQHLSDLRPGGRILDPFAGSGTTLAAAEIEGYDSIGVELSPDIAKTASERLQTDLRYIQEVHDEET